MVDQKPIDEQPLVAQPVQAQPLMYGDGQMPANQVQYQQQPMMAQPGQPMMAQPGQPMQMQAAPGQQVYVQPGMQQVQPQQPQVVYMQPGVQQPGGAMMVANPGGLGGGMLYSAPKGNASYPVIWPTEPVMVTCHHC